MVPLGYFDMVEVDGDWSYLRDRWKNQESFFELKAQQNKQKYFFYKRLTLIASWLTPFSIFIGFLIPTQYQGFYSLVPMLISTCAVGGYQWEELHNFGAQWAKYRLVAERLKHHFAMKHEKSGMYRGLSEDDAQSRFVESCEGIIAGTDVNYFVLMVDPLRQNDSH